MIYKVAIDAINRTTTDFKSNTNLPMHMWGVFWCRDDVFCKSICL